MPRIAHVPRSNTKRVASGSLGQSPYKSPLKIPLNDDAQEKAARMHSRHVLQEAQINQLKAAATNSPGRSKASLDGQEGGVGSPSSARGTPRRSGVGAGAGGRSSLGGSFADDLDDGMVFGGPGGGRGQSPVKRVPILANFEEWMKMATDNKINAANSWNFALIDYFHDMSLLREGDGVNFQKASCTLDGCVKIYTSRIDSVATETGKLLSGLADSGGKKKDRGEGAGEEGDESEDEVVDEDGNVKKKPKKKTQRSSEATLAPSFASLQLKKFELEFAVDPLFKKASADFDEGGAKGLLLNHLMIDSQGRIVFDSSDDSGDVAAAPKDTAAVDGEGEGNEGADNDEDAADRSVVKSKDTAAAEGPLELEDVEIDVAALGSRFFPDLSILDTLDICPSLKTFELGDPHGSMDIPFLRAPDDWRQQDQDHQNGHNGNKSAMFIDEDNPLGFDDDVDLGLFDLPGAAGDVAFGEGGEAWARQAALEPQMMMHAFGAAVEGDAAADDAGAGDGIEMLDADGANGDYVVTMRHGGSKEHEDILGYFDQALQKNWTSAEHWRIRKVKDIKTGAGGAAAASTTKRKEKEPFEIDFASPLDPALSDLIYTQAASNSAVCMPKKDWKSKSRNLLPDDKHFSSRTLLTLFLKPKARLGRKPTSAPATFVFGTQQQAQQEPAEVADRDMDEAFWAAHKGPQKGGAAGAGAEDTTVVPHGDYDANFFQDGGGRRAGDGAGADDDAADDEFADAREHQAGEGGANNANAAGAGGANANNNNNNNTITHDPGLGFTGMLNSTTYQLAFGTQLVTQQTRRVRPEYVQYARVAKKVDVRRLKEEIWKRMGFDEGAEKDGQKDDLARSRLLTPPAEPEDATTTVIAGDPTAADGKLVAAVGQEPAAGADSTLQFTSVMNDLQGVYPKQVMDDISTSYCFICLLHLANEKGLVISKTDDLNELDIRRDFTAEITAGGD